MSKAIIVKSDDWEGLFVDGVLVQEDHNLEGHGVKYLIQLSKAYDFKLEELEQGYVTEEYDDYLYSYGCFHKNLSDVHYIIEEE